MVVMGQLGRFVDGIKSKLRGGGKKGGGGKKAMVYDKMDKTDSMRVEIRSRRAQKLIAKNLMAADSMGHGGSGGGGGGGGKRFLFFAF